MKTPAQQTQRTHGTPIPNGVTPGTSGRSQDSTSSLIPETPPPKPSVIPRFIPTLTLAIMVGFWGALGRIPIRVVGQSILIQPRSIVPFQNRGSGGQVLDILVSPGARVQAGQLLAVLDLPELQEQLATREQKLAEFELENLAITNAQDRRSDLLEQTLQLESISIPPQIEANNMQIEAIDSELRAVEKQRTAYRERIAQLDEFVRLADERFESFRFLIAEGAVARVDSAIVDAENVYQTSQNERTSLFADLEDLSYRQEQLEAQQIQLEAQNQNLQAQLEDLRRQSADLELSDLQSDVDRQNAIDDLKRDISNLEAQIATESKVFAAYDGTIMTLSVNPGEYVPIGSQIGMLRIEREVDGSELMTFAFFTPEDAARIREGMKANTTPHLLTNRRFGGVRELFGSIPSEVTWVSPKTVTLQEVASIVGDSDLADALVQNPLPYAIPDNGRAQNLPVVQVRLELAENANNPSGYEWTQGKGPNSKLPEGTIGEARVTVEHRSLLSYAVGMARWLTGIYQE